MMLFHATFVLAVLLGFKVSWDAQEREGRLLPWGEVLSRTGRMAVVAAIWGAVVWHYAPAFFLWILPIVFGLCLAPVLVRYSSSLTLGERAAKAGIFITPNEVDADPSLHLLEQCLAHAAKAAPLSTSPRETWLPNPAPCTMPHSELDIFTARKLA
ncbi:MAG: hypothetical protein U5M23_02590 [Marinagarivorans sp.]|nr:hypothetical protein [Marinagarivorans sp.]